MRLRQRWIPWVLMLGLVGCSESETRWDTAQQESRDNPVAVSEAALPGAEFNRFFPQQGGEIDIVFKQEKDGFAQAALHRGGTPIAMLSISDTRNNPAAREKYGSSAELIAGHPAVVTDNETSILVADRFQVQVRSTGEALTAEDRAKWLGQFDLSGLANAF